MITIQVKRHQNLADIALEYYGYYEAIHFLIKDNPDLKSTADRITEGQELRIRKEAISEADVKNIGEVYTGQIFATGIGFDTIGDTFIVYPDQKNNQP